MRARTMRSFIWSASFLAGACLLGVVLLLSACASQQAGISTAEATPSAVVAPTVPALTPTPYPISAFLTPTTTPNATATSAANATATSAVIAGCSTGGSFYFESPPGPLPTTIPLPPGTLVQNHGFGISGGSADYPLCTPGATQAAITAYMDAALPAAGWTRTSPPGCNVNFPPGLWYKGHYGIQLVVGGTLPPDQWGLDVTYVC
jgi:hypothetical protein